MDSKEQPVVTSETKDFTTMAVLDCRGVEVTKWLIKVSFRRR